MAEQPRLLKKIGKWLFWSVVIIAGALFVLSLDNAEEVLKWAMIGGFAGYIYNQWETDRAHTRRALDAQSRHLIEIARKVDEMHAIIRLIRR